MASRHGSKKQQGAPGKVGEMEEPEISGVGMFGFLSELERRDMCSLSPGTVFASGLEDGAVD